MKRSLVIVGLLGLFLASALGQETFFLKAKIPFDFVVSGRTIPAGDYDFGISNNMVALRDHGTGRNVAQFGYMTRIAADKTATGSARISFDVKEDKHFIEAIWPEQGDGYLIHAVKGEHTHEVIRLK